MSRPGGLSEVQGPVEESSEISQEICRELALSGYVDARLVGQLICAVKQFNFTSGLVVGIDSLGYQRRYCYENESDAKQGLAGWDGREHPPGPWIKCKGADIDLLNPTLI